MRECVRDVFAIYDNNISPGLLMIIIKIIILYFIQIRHTDDFPPTGTPASTNIIAIFGFLDPENIDIETIINFPSILFADIMGLSQIIHWFLEAAHCDNGSEYWRGC